MCGIAGWVDLEADLSGECAVVEAMAKTLSPRGPDAGGFWASPHVLLGHRRLVVVDPEGGAQPMCRSFGGSQYVLVYNGELYNTAELTNELSLRGYRFLGHSDTEAVLLSYVEWGEKCLEKFNGIFAFGIWDGKMQRLMLARDRFGVKPLFYAQRGSSFIFASELKAMLAHPLIQPEVGAKGLAEVFAMGPSRTPGHGVYEGVRELEGGQFLFFGREDNLELRPRAYWQFQSAPHTDSFEKTVEKVRWLVVDTVIRQLVSDVPVCTFLSGGLDSSAITALAADHFKETGKGRLHTYSIHYRGNEAFFKPSRFQPDADDDYIQLMSYRKDTIHHAVTIETPEALADALADAALARDLPGMADIDSSLLLFCREIKKEHVVALSGECADEIFGGYPWFHTASAIETPTFPWMNALPQKLSVLSWGLLDYIRPEEYVRRRYEESLVRVPRLNGEDPLEARRREIFYLNIIWFMGLLLERKDRMSMACGLEVRVPYCDHRLAEYLWNVPWEMKSHSGREKGLLREALRGILPEEILQRKKSPYPKTHDPAYESAVKKRLWDILQSGSPLLPLLDMKKIKGLLEAPSDYGSPWFGQLMALPQLFAFLIQVDVWLREYKVSIK